MRDRSLGARMPTMRTLATLLATALILAGLFTSLPVSSEVQEKMVQRVGPGYADSDCVGDTSTPVCTVETYLACIARNDVELCGRAVPQLKMAFHPQAGPLHIRYQISAILELGPDRITRPLVSYRAEPGDVEIRLRRYECVYKDGNCSIDSTTKESYFLTRSKGRWIIFAWTDEKAPETCGELEGMDMRYHKRCSIYVYTPEEPWVHDPAVDSKIK